FHGTQYHHFGHAEATKLRSHTHGNETRFANPRFVENEPGQTDRDSEGRQASPYFFQRHIDIGQRQSETNRFTIDFGNGGEIVTQYWFHFRRHVVEFRLRERDKTPIIFPSFVV